MNSNSQTPRATALIDKPDTVTNPAGTIRVELQNALGDTPELPAGDQFRAWVNAALADSEAQIESGSCVTIRLVGSEESRQLNSSYRDIDKPTNVLAFPAGPQLAPELADDDTELGDLVICHEVAINEAKEQGKTQEAHLAHLVVHGTLHLVGYDHQNDAEAAVMERLETQVLQGIGLADPYQNQDRE